MAFSKDQMAGFEFDYSGLDMVGTSDPSVDSQRQTARLRELENCNEDLARRNAEFMAMFEGFKEDMEFMKESMQTAREELQSVRNHNARLQGEMSSLTKRKRTAARTKASDLEIAQAAEIEKLKKQLTQSKPEYLVVTPSDTGSATSSGELTNVFSDASASGHLSHCSMDNSRAAKRRHMEESQNWNDQPEMFQFNAGQPNCQNAYLGPVVQSDQSQQHLLPAHGQSFGRVTQGQDNSNYQMSYGQEHMYGQGNQMPWGNAFSMNPQLQHQQEHGMPSYPKPPQGLRWSF
ncbi:uncharacterized protein F4812DRAFT_465432 [Daldinia caldariorum]|uniref:uncharacterized protein n=1 Tax=Daldinia caldariorum TaxID=326644 RepID=UPI0020081985|nr:uncharacterized protein F4812DRAFT_465432 [Daldinia caldariorum]KAI1466700.1 hypothetical protein F4812DRAFT_465432 [Daldinia caldariorum]